MVTVTSCTPWDLPKPSASDHSNLQCFLQCITPTLPTTRLLPKKKCIQDFNSLSQTHDEKAKDMVEGFTLSELWESYTEWSYYGAAVPILLNNGHRVVQYYTPSLSALQIYTKKPFSSPRSVFHPIDEKIWGLGSGAQNGNGSCGCLYYQYDEIMSPYDRVPLIEKINELAKHYPGLVDLHSTDLSPYSWMAIAWYPVYQIPSAKNAKELSACFLTYHPLSSLSRGQGSNNIMLEKEEEQGQCCAGEEKRSGSRKEEIYSLPPFAVVTYKMFGRLWINPKTSDQDIIMCQQTAACYWLKQLQFQHHDFNFFMSRQFLNF